MLVIGVDPGTMTGVALFGPDGLGAHWQDHKSEAVRRLINELRSANDSHLVMAIEDAFVGPSAFSSLIVAKNHGWVLGALWCAGVTYQNLWTPKAMEWRKVHGFKSGAKNAHAAALSYAAGQTGSEFKPGRIHEAEAICIAAASWELMVDPKQMSLEAT